MHDIFQKLIQLNNRFKQECTVFPPETFDLEFDKESFQVIVISNTDPATRRPYLTNKEIELVKRHFLAFASRETKQSPEAIFSFLPF